MLSIRYLDAYEKVYFHGADPNQRDDEEDTEGPLRKKACLPLYGIPLSYNYDQHRVSGRYTVTHYPSSYLKRLTKGQGILFVFIGDSFPRMDNFSLERRFFFLILINYFFMMFLCLVGLLLTKILPAQSIW